MKKLSLAILAVITLGAQAFDLPKEVMLAHYRIAIKNTMGRRIDCGTGVAFEKRKLITAEHVISHCTHKDDDCTIEVDLCDENGDFTGKHIAGKLGRWELALDQAIVETDEDLPHVIDLHFTKPAFGDRIYAVGAAWGDAPYTCASGDQVMAHNEVFDHLSQSSCTTGRGMSGGGVWTKEGQYCGMILRAADAVGTLYVPSAAVQKFIQGKKFDEADNVNHRSDPSRGPRDDEDD